MTKYNSNAFKIAGSVVVILFLIGVFYISSVLLSVTENSLENLKIIKIPPEMQEFKISIGLLLASASPVALLLTWAFSKKITTTVNLSRYFLSLLIAFLALGLGLYFRFVEIKGIIAPPNTNISMASIDYLEYGLKSQLFICLPLAFIIYKRKKDNTK